MRNALRNSSTIRGGCLQEEDAHVMMHAAAQVFPVHEELTVMHMHARHSSTACDAMCAYNNNWFELKKCVTFARLMP